MGLYLTKQKLYKKVALFKKQLGLCDDMYRINCMKICEEYSIKIGFLAFTTPGLRGMASIGENGKSDVIILNSTRTFCEQNFDCGHELMHLFLHKNENKPSFTCFEKVLKNRNSYLEWHANEGSAEFILPYKSFIPNFYEGFKQCKNHKDYWNLKNRLSEIYFVPETVVTLRIKNLGYEIEQYSKGVSVNDIDLKSYSELNRANIRPQNYDCLGHFLAYM